MAASKTAGFWHKFIVGNGKKCRTQPSFGKPGLFEKSVEIKVLLHFRKQTQSFSILEYKHTKNHPQVFNVLSLIHHQ